MSSYYIAPVIHSNRSSGEWAISPRRSLDIIDPRCHARMALDDEAIANLPPVLFASQDGVQHDHPDDSDAEDSSRKSDSSNGAGHVSRRKLMPGDLHQKNSPPKSSMDEKKNSTLWCSSSKNPRSHTLNFQPASRVARANGV